jgi:DNA recombination protein RmuC
VELLGFAVLGVAVLAGAIVAAAVLFARAARVAPVPSSFETVARQLGQLQAEVARIVSTQDQLRHEVHRGREASLREMADATQDLRGEIGAAQRALAEVKALEQGRARQMEQAAESLRRLEAVIAGSGSRGAAGENILARALGQLPPDLLELNVPFGSRVVEYALRLPGGRLLPIDSKWTSAASLERLSTTDDPQERRRLVEQVARELRVRVRELVKYLDPERTLSLALLAVPDSVYGAAPEVHGEGYREGILVVPYSLALPYVLALYRLTVRFGSAVDADRLAGRLATLDESLRRLDDEVEGRLSRGLVQVENARDALRHRLAEARRTLERLQPPAETLPTGDHPFDDRLRTG